MHSHRIDRIQLRAGSGAWRDGAIGQPVHRRHRHLVVPSRGHSPVPGEHVDRGRHRRAGPHVPCGLEHACRSVRRARHHQSRSLRRRGRPHRDRAVDTAHAARRHRRPQNGSARQRHRQRDLRARRMAPEFLRRGARLRCSSVGLSDRRPHGPRGGRHAHAVVLGRRPRALDVRSHRNASDRNPGRRRQSRQTHSDVAGAIAQRKRRHHRVRRPRPLGAGAAAADRPQPSRRRAVIGTVGSLATPRRQLRA